MKILFVVLILLLPELLYAGVLLYAATRGAAAIISKRKFICTFVQGIRSLHCKDVFCPPYVRIFSTIAIVIEWNMVLDVLKMHQVRLETAAPWWIIPRQKSTTIFLNFHGIYFSDIPHAFAHLQTWL